MVNLKSFFAAALVAAGLSLGSVSLAAVTSCTPESALGSIDSTCQGLVGQSLDTCVSQTLGKCPPPNGWHDGDLNASDGDLLKRCLHGDFKGALCRWVVRQCIPNKNRQDLNCKKECASHWLKHDGQYSSCLRTCEGRDPKTGDALPACDE